MYKSKFITWLDQVLTEALESSLYTKNGGGFSLDWFIKTKLAAAPTLGILGRELEQQEIDLISKIIEKHGIEAGLDMIRKANTVADLQSALKARRSKSAKQGRTVQPHSADRTSVAGRISDYAVASASEPAALIRRVKVLLEKGYEPTGGVSVAVRHDPNVEVLWSQAMIKRST